MKSQEEVRDWLIARVAKLAALEPARIETGNEFQSYGISSVRLVEMSGELEEFTGVRVDPSLFWEHSTIDAMAAHLTAAG